jgi:hypothetical protein
MELSINPWLESQIARLQEEVPALVLRDAYRERLQKEEDLPWPVFLMEKALTHAISRNLFLKTIRFRMELPLKTLEGLYWAGVDTVADLLQLTEEELQALSRREEVDVEAVKRFLKSHGLGLDHAPGRTIKYHPIVGFRMIPSPGAGHAFDWRRPTLCLEWFDWFYRERCGFVQLDAYDTLFPNVLLPDLAGGDIPYDYKEIFEAAGRLWQAYEKCCAGCRIQPRVDRPHLPTLEVKTLYWESWRAVIDIFERTTLLDRELVTLYLDGTDDGRLDVADGVQDKDLEYLLVSLVEVKIDVENIVLYFAENLKKDQLYSINPGPRSVDGETASRIRDMRARASDENLRERYLKALEANPGLSWEEFILQAAKEKA